MLGIDLTGVPLFFKDEPYMAYEGGDFIFLIFNIIIKYQQF